MNKKVIASIIVIVFVILLVLGIVAGFETDQLSIILSSLSGVS